MVSEIVTDVTHPVTQMSDVRCDHGGDREQESVQIYIVGQRVEVSVDRLWCIWCPGNPVVLSVLCDRLHGTHVSKYSSTL